MLIEIREPSGMVSRVTADPDVQFWAFVASLELRFPTATICRLRAR